MNTFDIVICIGDHDTKIAHKMIRYVQNKIIGYRNIFLIPSADNFSHEYCITINEDKFPFTQKDIELYHGKNERNKWYLQQLYKLYSGFVIPGILENYTVIDADVLFLKKKVLFENNLPIYNYGTEYHQPYFDHMKKLHPDLIKMDKEKSGICHFITFQKKYIVELFNLVESYHNGTEFWKVFLLNVDKQNLLLSGSSEYEIYFNFMLKNHSDKMIIKKLKWTSPFQLNSLHYKYYDYVVVHWHKGEQNVNFAMNK
jgi:uncharacterized short protein YbdD (DUF466 family)